ncbi:MAG: sterol carrier protein domain-containing protein, partial [Candidatus Sumerlaeota bacterium]|nr:sterol carrier protein domain-containing protein [Candidatus Sumerlaeota bacterium]
WMLRVVDVAAALEARGYPPAFEAELHFEIQDDWLPWNNGRFVLQVSNGRGEVSPGGQGRLRMHVRRLAQLYTGHLSPGELRVVGDAEGPPADWAAAGLAFSGPRPWMADLF